MVPASEKETDDKTRGGGGENILSKAPFLPRCGDLSFPSHPFQRTKPPHWTALPGDKRHTNQAPFPRQPSQNPTYPTRPEDLNNGFPHSHCLMIHDHVLYFHLNLFFVTPSRLRAPSHL